MSTNLLEQLRVYGEDFEADMSPVTIEELVHNTDGPVRVQPLNKQTRRPIPGWVSAVAAAAVVLLIGGVAFVLRDSGGPGAPAASTPPTVAPTTVAPTTPPPAFGGWSQISDAGGVFGGPDRQVMNDVIVAGPGFVAVGEDGGDAAVWTSVDGSDWSRVPDDETVFGDAGMSSVVASGPVVVAVGGRDVWTSRDGISWTRVAYDETIFGDAGIRDITVGGPGFVAVGSTYRDGDHDGDRNAVVWTSVDGISWSRVAHDETVFGGLYNQDMMSVTTGGPGLVAVGYDGNFTWDDPFGTAAVWTSVDGLVWSRVPESAFAGSSSMLSVTAGGPGLVAVGYEFGCRPIWTSVDGLVWSRVPQDVPGACNRPIRSVIVDSEGLVAVGRNAISWTSIDGITWTQTADGHATPGFRWMRSVTASDVGLVAVGNVDIDPGSNNADDPVRLDADGEPVKQSDAAVWLQE